METVMIEKCMLQPVNPLMVGQSQAIPKKLPPSIHLQPWICSFPTPSWQERCWRLGGVHEPCSYVQGEPRTRLLSTLPTPSLMLSVSLEENM